MVKKVKHGAQFTDVILDRAEPILKEFGLHVHDCFAGPGERLGALCDRLGLGFSGTELQLPFIVDRRVKQGDATDPSTYPTGDYVLFTSPVYPSGCTDHLKPNGKRNTYREWLAATVGDLTVELDMANAGRHGPRGGKRAEQRYWLIQHRAIFHWPSVAIVNVSDCPVNYERYPTADFYALLMECHGYQVVDRIQMKTPRLKRGENAHRAEFEEILVCRRHGGDGDRRHGGDGESPGRSEAPSYKAPRLRGTQATPGPSKSAAEMTEAIRARGSAMHDAYVAEYGQDGADDGERGDYDLTHHDDLLSPAQRQALHEQAMAQLSRSIVDPEANLDNKKAAIIARERFRLSDVARQGLEIIDRLRRVGPWPDNPISEATGPTPLSKPGQYRMARARLEAGVELNDRDRWALDDHAHVEDRDDKVEE
jgi:hypothetical protein